MKKRKLVLIVIFFLVFGGAAFADPLTDAGAEWLSELEELARLGNASINVEEMEFNNDSFFDVFVDVVLREGLPRDIQDPNFPEGGLDSDDVTRIIEELGPELREALRLVLPDGTEISVAPGAAVFKWDKEGRWCTGPHSFEIYNWVRVNQWIRASMNTSKLVWKVFKPGTYSTDCMYLNVHSNAGMKLTLENLGPLLGDATTDAEISTEYALSQYISTPMDLVLSGRDMLGAPPVIDWVPDGGIGEQEVGPHALVKVWNSITVGSSVAPGLFTTPDGPSAVITVAPTL